MSAAVAPLPDECPRTVHSQQGGKTLLKTCGHTLPCPYHGEPIVRSLPTGEAS